MMDLLSTAPPLRKGGKKRNRILPVGTYGFSFIHSVLGTVTIRNATLSDVPLLRDTLFKPGSIPYADVSGRQFGEPSGWPSEQDVINLLGSSTVLMVTSPRETGEAVIAAITLFKADAHSDLRRALERSAYDGNDTVRIDWLDTFEKVVGFDRRPMIVGKEVLTRVLREARRKNGVILIVRSVAVDAAYGSSGILKFVSRKIDRIVKYVYGCSHIIGEDTSTDTPYENDDSGNRTSLRETLKGIDFGRWESALQAGADSGIDAVGTKDLLWISSCETVFDIRAKKSSLRTVPRIAVRSLRDKVRKVG